MIAAALRRRMLMAPRTGKKRHGLVQARSKPRAPRPSIQAGAYADGAAQLPLEDAAVSAGIVAPLEAAAPSAHRQSPPPSPISPDLQAGIEALSGVSLDDVRVHRNASTPARLRADAFAQGGDIHLAPGESEHPRHQAWQVVRQEQGRVKATPGGKGDVLVNDSAGLEREADAMAERAVRRSRRPREPR